MKRGVYSTINEVKPVNPDMDKRDGAYICMFTLCGVELFTVVLMVHED